MPRVRDIAAPEMPTNESLLDLGTAAAYGVRTARKGSGGWNSAQGELTTLANEMLRGQTPHLRGGYSLADKYADRPTFSNRPYRTAVLYASGRAGRRALGGKV